MSMNKISIITLSRQKSYILLAISLERYFPCDGHLDYTKSCPCLAIENRLGHDSREQCVTAWLLISTATYFVELNNVLSRYMPHT